MPAFIFLLLLHTLPPCLPYLIDCALEPRARIKPSVDSLKQQEKYGPTATHFVTVTLLGPAVSASAS